MRGKESLRDIPASKRKWTDRIKGSLFCNSHSVSGCRLWASMAADSTEEKLDVRCLLRRDHHWPCKRGWTWGRLGAWMRPPAGSKEGHAGWRRGCLTLGGRVCAARAGCSRLQRGDSSAPHLSDMQNHEEGLTLSRESGYFRRRGRPCLDWGPERRFWRVGKFVVLIWVVITRVLQYIKYYIFISCIWFCFTITRNS